MSNKLKTNPVDFHNKLNDNNYLLWHKEATTVFEDENLVDKQKQAGPNDDPFCIKDTARAQRITFSNVSQSIQNQLVNLKTASEMWNYTYKEFSGKPKMLNHPRRNPIPLGSQFLVWVKSHLYAHQFWNVTKDSPADSTIAENVITSLLSDSLYEAVLAEGPFNDEYTSTWILY
jgi:hypothetical protein